MGAENQIPPATPKRAVETVILSASPVVGVALQHLLEDRVVELTTYRLDLSELQATPPLSCPDLLVLAPQSWRDLELWLAQLQSRFSACPWLLFSEPRVAGLFLSQLSELRCVFVPTTASPALLRAAIRTAMSEDAASFSAAYVNLYTTLLVAHVTGSSNPSPTVEELRCACAVSLGLNDREIARLMRVRLPAVRRHLHRLLLALGVSGLDEVAAVVEHALSPATLVSECLKLYHPDPTRARSRP